MKTVADLKQFLQEMVDNLDMMYNDDQELNIVGNTYWVESSTFLGTHDGFIDLRDPVGTRYEADDDDDEDEECDE